MFLFTSVMGSGGGMGTAGSSGASPWHEITGRAFATWYQNTLSNPIAQIARIQGNNSTSISDFICHRSTDGSTVADQESHGNTENEKNSVWLAATIGASEYSRVEQSTLNSNTAFTDNGRYYQEITGGADDFVDETASRAVDGTVYHNTTGNPIFVIVATVGNNSGSDSSFLFQISADGSTGWASLAQDKTTSNRNWLNMAAVVPNGYYYRVYKYSGSNTAAAVTMWIEKRLTGNSGALTDVAGSRAVDGTSYQNTAAQKMAAHVLIMGNDVSSLSHFTFEISSDGSTWTEDTGGFTENYIGSVHLFGIVPAGYYYRARKSAGSNSIYALKNWLEQLLG